MGPWDLASAIGKCLPANTRAGNRIQLQMSPKSSSPEASFQSCLGPGRDLLSVASAAAIIRVDVFVAEKCTCCNPFLTCTWSVLYLTDPHVMYIWGLSFLGQNDLAAGFLYQMVFQSRSFQYKSFMIALISLVNFLLDLPFFIALSNSFPSLALHLLRIDLKLIHE